MNDNSNTLEVAAVFSTDTQAHIAKGVLDANEINSEIENELLAGVLPIGFNSIGGLRLLVNSRDLAKANEILSTLAF